MTRNYYLLLPCLALLTYGILAFRLLPAVFDDSDISVFFVQGVVLVLTGVVVAVNNDDHFHWISGRLSASGGGLATRLGLANPLAKRVRTGLLLAMYALIVFVLVFMAVFAAVFQAQAPRITAETSAGEHPMATIAFGRIDGENVYARVGDEPFVVAARRAVLDNIFATTDRELDIDISFNRSADGKQQNPCRSLLLAYATKPSISAASTTPTRSTADTTGPPSSMEPSSGSMGISARGNQ